MMALVIPWGVNICFFLCDLCDVYIFPAVADACAVTGTWYTEPYDCNKYFQCNNSEKVENTCPGDNVFSVKDILCIDDPSCVQLISKFFIYNWFTKSYVIVK